MPTLKTAPRPARSNHTTLTSPAARGWSFRLHPDAHCLTPTTPGLPYGGSSAPQRHHAQRPAPGVDAFVVAGAMVPVTVEMPVCAAVKPPRDRSGDAARYRPGLTVRARNRRAAAATLPWGFTLDVRATGAALAATVEAATGGVSEPLSTGGGYMVTAGAAAGERWLMSPVGVGRAFTAEGRAWRLTSPVLRGAVDTRDDAPVQPVAGGAGGAVEPASAITDLPRVSELVAALRGAKGLRVAPGASLTVSLGVAGATLRQVANLAATLSNAGPYLDAALRGLDGDTYRRDRDPPKRGRKAVPAGTGEGVEVQGAAVPTNPAPAKAAKPRKPSDTPGTTPEVLATVRAADTVVRQVPAGAVEALRAAIGRRGKAPATGAAEAAMVAEVWATHTRSGEGDAPCILDLGHLARGVVVFRLPGTVNAAELRAWVEAVTLFVGRALASAHVRLRTNRVDTQVGTTLASRLAQGLRRLLHDAGMVGKVGAPAVARSWLVHRVAGPTETAAQARLRTKAGV